LIKIVLDLPHSIKEGERLSVEFMRQAKAVRNTDPTLRETLDAKTKNLRLDTNPPGQSIEIENDSPTESSEEIAKTQIVSSAEKNTRFVGQNQRYRIDKAIASGGAGIVYQAEDTVLSRKVALKELLEDVATDEEQAERFKSEARALALLNHNHILPIYDLFEENGRFWLVMELLTGGTLNDKINGGALDTAQSIEIIKGIASGLEIAHQKGFVHRDIKPANILFAEDGSVRITDFGIAKHQATGIKTSHGLILGSPGYMSPEQAAGEPVDARSDIYSLGITMFQMLTGELPFQGDVSSVMAQHITKPVPRPSTINTSISKDLDNGILKMLAKQPEARFQSMADLINALAELS
jgi:serine/threonine-protein kinase